MKEGLELFWEVCAAGSPVDAVRDLADSELELLGDALGGLPTSGIPGVVAGQVTVEMARRWRIERVTEKERVEGEE